MMTTTIETFPAMTPRQGRALARFLHELRPDWDTDGIDAQLGYARGLGTAPELAIAAIRAACSAKNRTPAAIGHQGGEHWQPATTTAKRPRSGTRQEQCTECGQTEDRCRQISRLGDDGHEFTPNRLRVDGQLVDAKTGEVIDLPDPSNHLEQLREATRRSKTA
jgi:hypothetical protein